jgi:hypothetical protein
MYFTFIGGKGLIGDRLRQVQSGRNDDRSTQQPVQPLHVCGFGWGRQENGHRDTPLHHNDAIKFSAMDPIEDV